jgi:hypothetical protein
MRYLWCGWDRASVWVPLMAAKHPLPADTLIVSGWSLATCSRMDALESAAAACRERGIRMIPSGHLFGSDGIKRGGPEAYYDRSFWAMCLPGLERLAAIADSFGRKDIAIDFEGYYQGLSPKYPDPSKYLDVLAAADPVIEWFRTRGYTPWVAPGHIGLLPAKAFFVSGLRCVFLDERSYLWGSRLSPENGLIDYRLRAKEFASTQHRYLPGVYAQAMKNPDWVRVMAANGIDDYWVYFRSVDSPETCW